MATPNDIIGTYLNTWVTDTTDHLFTTLDTQYPGLSAALLSANVDLNSCQLVRDIDNKLYKVRLGGHDVNLGTLREKIRPSSTIAVLEKRNVGSGEEYLELHIEMTAVQDAILNYYNTYHSESIDAPSIVSPDMNEADPDIVETVITTTPFVSDIVGDSHQSSSWQIATDSSFINKVVDIEHDPLQLTTLTLTSVLAISTVYYVRAKHTGLELTSKWGQVQRFTTLTAIIATPSIVVPTDGAVDVQYTTIITGSTYTPAGHTESHLSTDWQIATDIGFTTIVHQRMGDTTNLTTIGSTIRQLSGVLENTQYYARVRYRSATHESLWSSTVGFTTEAIFDYLESQKLGASDGAVGDMFGVSVALSADKSILVVGAFRDDGGTDTGSVYVYQQNVGTNIYNPIHIQKLNASDRAAGDLFGASVSLSVDKSVLVVGAHGDDDGGNDTGSVYIYKQNVGLNTYNPAHIQKLGASDRAAGDLFGASVALSADKSILVVGAPGVDAGDTATGSVYIYKQDAGADTYNTAHIQKLNASDRTAVDWFGVSVSLSSDKSILIVGAYGVNGVGAVYIYRQDTGADTYNPVHVQKLFASDNAGNDQFGISVAISADKSILVVGAHGDDDGDTDTGSVYIYQQDAGLDTYNPVHIQKLTASDRTAWDRFGRSVSLSADKSILIVGAYGDDDGGTDTGSVYITIRSV